MSETRSSQDVINVSSMVNALPSPVAEASTMLSLRSRPMTSDEDIEIPTADYLKQDLRDRPDKAPSASEQSQLIQGLTSIISLFSTMLANTSDKGNPLTVTSSDAYEHIKVLSKSLDIVVTSSAKDTPIIRNIIPPEDCEPGSLSRSAATLDMHKIKLIMSASSLTTIDLHSYAELLQSEQEKFRRKHRRSYPLDESSMGIYTPSDADSIKFVDDNATISDMFGLELAADQYFHVLKAFTHESATEGRTSSKLLSMIGRYALKMATYRLSYSNGEPYEYAKATVYNLLDEDLLYDQFIKLKLHDLIIVGPDCFNHDKEIVLQTLYAIFGFTYFLNGINGMINLNRYIQWSNIRMSGLW